MSEHQKTTQVVLSTMEDPKEHQTIESIAIFVETEPGVYNNLLTSQASALSTVFAALAELDGRITALEGP